MRVLKIYPTESVKVERFLSHAKEIAHVADIDRHCLIIDIPGFCKYYYGGNEDTRLAIRDVQRVIVDKINIIKYGRHIPAQVITAAKSSGIKVAICQEK